MNIVASIGLKSNLRPVETSTGNVQLPPTGRLLLSAARMTTKWPGAKSRFGKYFRRKFAEQGRGASYHVQTNRRFLFSGLIGDNVDNKIAIDLDYEPALSDFIAREAAGTKAFLDIGCNVGWFSCLAASLADPPQRILAIDANPLMVEACQRNLRLNVYQADTLVRAFGPERGSITLHVPLKRHSRASIGLENAAHFGETRALEVRMSPLEDLLECLPGGRCDLIKMDIEGYELEALRQVPPDIISRVGIIVMEYTRSNLEGCGYAGMTLGVLPWLDLFSVQAMNARGELHDVGSPATFSPKETTFILRNRTWQP